ncbi:MAG TPA: SDR family oxidoreductase [Trebonia sp.]|jgi:nucleoside-diphosphate-sugar epimerase
MHVFVTGGSGLTGPSIVAGLIAAGHSVTGLARSEASAGRLRGLGAGVLRGDLDDLDSLRAGAASADGVVHMAFGGDFADTGDMMRRDRAAITALGEGLASSGTGTSASSATSSGQGKPFVITSGTLVMPAGRVSGEGDVPDPASIAGFRIPGEQACLGFAGRGVRSVVVRLAPTVHGPGDVGFIAMLVQAARRTGVSAHVGTGANRWPAIHRSDAATLYRLALEKAPAGSVLHGASESAVTMRGIAGEIGEGLGLPVVSVTRDEAAAHFGSPFMAAVYGTDCPASSARTRSLLGWAPSRPGLLADLRDGDYLTVAVSQP